jgi:hypothetical protein
MDLSGNFVADAQVLSDAEADALRSEAGVAEISGTAYRDGQPIMVRLRSDVVLDEPTQIYPEHLAIAAIFLANVVVIVARIWG